MDLVLACSLACDRCTLHIRCPSSFACSLLYRFTDDSSRNHRLLVLKVFFAPNNKFRTGRAGFGIQGGVGLLGLAASRLGFNTRDDWHEADSN